MSTVTNLKLFAIREAISKAIKENALEARMDVIKLQAAEIGLDEKSLEDLILEQKWSSEKQNKIQQVVSKNKIKYGVIGFAAVALEWIIGVSLGPLSLSKVLWLLALNLITTLLIVLVLSYRLNKKIQ